MEFKELTSDHAILEELGKRVREARLDRNLSQADVSAKAGIGRMTLQRMEAGEPFSLTSLIRVLRVLGMLDGLERLMPETSPSPIDELKRQGQRRQRAGSPRSTATQNPPSPWRWGDEESEESG